MRLHLLPKKMTTKMTFAVSILVVIVISLTAFASLSFLQEEFKKAEHLRQSTLVSLLGQQLDERIIFMKSMLKGIASLAGPEVIASKSRSQKLLQSRPNAAAQLSGGMFLFNAHGTLVARHPDNTRASLDTIPWQGVYKATMESGTSLISPPFAMGGGTGQQEVYVLLTQPTRDRNGAVTGVVMGALAISSHEFLSKLTDQTLGSDAYVHIYTRNRTIIGHHDRSKLLTTIPAGVNPLLDRAVSGEEITGECITICGVPALSTFHHIQGTSWILEVGYPLEKVYAPFRTARNLYLAGGAVITLLAMIATWLVMRYMTIPLLTMSRQLQVMGDQAGALQPLVSVADGEIGVLTEAFNSLISDLKESREEIEERSRFVSTLLDTLPLSVVYKDSSGVIKECNKAYEHFVQLPRQDILGKTTESLYSRATAAQTREVDEEVLTTGQSRVYERDYSSREGAPRHMLVHKSPFRNRAGDITGLIVCLTDITEQKLVEEKIASARDFYLTLFEKFPGLIWRSGLDARCDYFNQTWLDFTGRTIEQELGNGWTQVVHPEDLGRCLETYRNAFDSRQPFEMEYRLRRHDGDFRWLQDMGRPFTDLDGHFAGYIGVCFDITEHKELKRQIIEAQRMEAIGTLTGGIAHDFNNIMTVIQGHANLLQMRIGQEERLTKSVDQILLASERAVALTQSLLLYSRRQVSSPTIVDLNDIVKGIQELMRGALREDMPLHLSLVEIPLTVKADARQLEQVLMNLVVNARDALGQGGEITIATDLTHLDEEEASRLKGLGSAGDYCLLAVSDNGSGMDEETCKRIFEPFFTTKEVGKGTGLGLSVVYGIVTHHKGLLECVSTQGEGTTFRIYLPLTLSRAAEPPTYMDAALPARGNETILLAEDETLLRLYAREMLEEYGYSVIEAVDGEDAVFQFQQHADTIDLLILDVIMPKKNGREVFEEACRIRPGIKTIFTSGYTADILGEKNIIASDVNFLSKPVAPDMFLAKIREVLDA